MIHTALNPNHIQKNTKLRLFACFTVLIVVLCFGISILRNINSRNHSYKIQENGLNHVLNMNNRNLISYVNSSGFYSLIALNESYIGTWKRLPSEESTDSVSVSGNAKLVFNLKLTTDKNYALNTTITLYENSKAFINTFVFSKLNAPSPSSITSLSINDKDSEYIFKGNIISLINDKRIFFKGMEICTGYLSIGFHSLNNKIIGNLTTGNCSINLQYEAKLEDKHSKDKNISLYTILLGIITIMSIISQLVCANQIEGNMQHSNSLCLLNIDLNMLWTVYNLYSHIFLLYINKNYFYQFIPLMLLFLFHFSCDMKVWIFSIETKYNDTRSISILTFLALTASFSSYFLGLGFYFEKNYILLHMILIWYPQVIYNIIYFNTSLFPIAYMIVVTVYRTFIPFYFSTKEINFVEIDINYTLIKIYICIILSSILLMLSQYAFGSRWFIPIRAFRERRDSLYKRKDEILELIPSAENLQCAICLNELLVNHNVIFCEDFEYASDCRTPFRFSKISTVNESKGNMIISLIFCFNNRLNSSRKEYMLTNCCHAFHSGCLEVWLEFKKECPNCRRKIRK